MLRFSTTLALTLTIALTLVSCGDSAETGGASSDDIAASGSDASTGDTSSVGDQSGDSADATGTADTTQTADTTDPTDTSDPTDPTDTSDPTDPADPADPADPWADGCPDEVFLDASYPWVGAGPSYDALTLSVSCDVDAGTMTVTSNGIPHYSYVSMTPNALVTVNHSWTITLNPEVAAEPTDIPFLGDAGFAVNGNVWYGPNEGPTPDNFGDPVANDIMDWCGGHTASAYHFHAMFETMLYDADGDGEPTCMDPDENYVWGAQASPILGFALDGFPIYGPHGCLDTECAEVVEFKSSWENQGYKEGTVGCQTTSECGNPTSCDSGFPSGNFDPNVCYICNNTIINAEETTACLPLSEAWVNNVHVPKDGDLWLDKCNGRYAPDGSYRYHTTATFPYILGCYSGTASSTGGGTGRGGDDGGPPDGGPPDGGPPDGGPPDGPASCITDVDCDGACPNVPKGCVCNQSPNGMICVPSCSSDADCPPGLSCDTAGGICIPG